MNPFQAAIEGKREIGPAVMATTLSLMADFVPIGFMQGIVGKFMSSFGLTASFAVAVSLLVSFTLTPMLAARLIKKEDKEPRKDEGLKSEITGDGMMETNKSGRLAEEETSHYTGWFKTRRRSLYYDAPIRDGSSMGDPSCLSCYILDDLSSLRRHSRYGLDGSWKEFPSRRRSVAVRSFDPGARRNKSGRNIAVV
jgi:hypothetical protein